MKAVKYRLSILPGLIGAILFATGASCEPSRLIAVSEHQNSSQAPSTRSRKLEEFSIEFAVRIAAETPTGPLGCRPVRRWTLTVFCKGFRVGRGRRSCSHVAHRSAGFGLLLGPLGPLAADAYRVPQNASLPPDTCPGQNYHNASPLHSNAQRFCGSPMDAMKSFSHEEAFGC